MKIRYAAALAAISIIMAGCETTGPVRQVSASDASHQTLGVDQSDVNATVQQMVASMLSSPNVMRITADEAPTVVVVPVRLDTSTITDTRINTDAITTLVTEQIINSGLFQFIDANRRQDIAGEVAYQNDSGKDNKPTAVQRGKQFGAKYILEGTVSGFDAYTGTTRKKGYVIKLSLQNVETGQIIWMQSKQIAKEQTRNTFGG
jgi:hypothetical protein